jgi:hypothetical protein
MIVGDQEEFVVVKVARTMKEYAVSAIQPNKMDLMVVDLSLKQNYLALMFSALGVFAEKSLIFEEMKKRTSQENPHHLHLLLLHLQEGLLVVEMEQLSSSIWWDEAIDIVVLDY